MKKDKTNPITKRLYSTNDVARYLCVDPKIVRSLIKSGSLPRVQVGQKKFLVDVEDLDRYVNENKFVDCLLK